MHLSRKTLRYANRPVRDFAGVTHTTSVHAATTKLVIATLHQATRLNFAKAGLSMILMRMTTSLGEVTAHERSEVVRRQKVVKESDAKVK